MNFYVFVIFVFVFPLVAQAPWGARHIWHWHTSPGSQTSSMISLTTILTAWVRTCYIKHTDLTYSTPLCGLAYLLPSGSKIEPSYNHDSICSDFEDSSVIFPSNARVLNPPGKHFTDFSNRVKNPSVNLTNGNIYLVDMLSNFTYNTSINFKPSLTNKIRFLLLYQITSCPCQSHPASMTISMWTCLTWDSSSHCLFWNIKSY